ncbi:phospholipase D-like domain-containing protein [Myxococcota bacterium]|nr:phospholipase D-like domain-containing protein [Myxococcota bacterium]
MDIQQFRTFLQQSFDDQQLSRNEATVFKQLLEDAQPSTEQLQLLRHEIFACAQQALRHPQERLALEWIASLTKILLQQSPTQTTDADEALFFPDARSYARLLEVLQSARKTLDVCVYTITDDRLSRILEKAHQNGLSVRILSDNDKAADLGSDVTNLNQTGIPTAVDQNSDHMHHKFAILDQSILLNGSFNWTRSASTNNHENLIITRNPSMIRAFQQEFDRLWALYARPTTSSRS